MIAATRTDGGIDRRGVPSAVGTGGLGKSARLKPDRPRSQGRDDARHVHPRAMNPDRGLARRQGVTTSVQVPAPLPGAAPDGVPAGLRRVLGALAGLLAAAVALGVAELVAGLVGPASSPVIAVGDAAITLTPEPVKDFAIRTFGENDKVALVAGTLVVIAVYALVVGLVAPAQPPLGVLGIAAVRRSSARVAAAHPARRRPARRAAVAGRRGRRASSPCWPCSPR